MIEIRPSVPEDAARLYAAFGATVSDLFEHGYVPMLGWSGGKDSSVMASLLFNVAAQRRRKGHQVPPIIVTHGDTGVENPEMRIYADREIRKMQTFAHAHGIDAHIYVARPNISEHWASRVIGGRALPSYSGTNRDCSKELKINPQNRLRAQIIASHGLDERRTFTMIGTRREESATRKSNMDERGETAATLWAGPDGRRYLSPLADWTEGDIYEYIGYAASHMIASYSDFEETKRIYAHSGGSTCVVVGAAKDVSKPCGARTGCAVCTPIGRDRSLENMIAFDPRYRYLKPVNRLQQFLVNIRWDMDRRLWVGRTINEWGYVAVQPDVFSPATLAELLRYALSVDYIEAKRAGRMGIPPRIQLVPENVLVYIDAYWSLQGYHKPFEALRIYRDVFHRGGARLPPRSDPTPQRPMPEKRYLYVGRDYDQDLRWKTVGLKDPMIDAFGGAGCGRVVRTRTHGGGWHEDQLAIDVQVSRSIEVDEESAAMLLGFELDFLCDRYQGPLLEGVNATAGYLYYLTYGALKLARGREGKIDYILRRTAFKQRNGLAFQGGNAKAIAESIAYADLPAHVKTEMTHAKERSQESGNAEDATTALIQKIREESTQLALFV